MLKPAILYADPLQRRFVETLFQDRFLFYSRGSDINYLIPIAQNSGEILQFVSLNESGKVIGYLGARINRETDTAYDFQVINFEQKNDIFTLDLFDFFTQLYTKFGASRVVWWMIIGNPVEPLYDRFINSYGGRIVGTFKQDTKLYDGQLYDVKWYEILKSDFFDAINRVGVDRFTWRNGGVMNG